MECPYEFYRDWVLDPHKAKARAEPVARSTVGTDECPIAGLPTQKVVVPPVEKPQPVVVSVSS
jgi:amidase